MESQQSQPGRHEYRMKVSKSGLYLLVAAILIAASVPIATRGHAWANIPTTLGRVVIGALLMFCGVFMVATVLRSRLVIEESQIRFRVVFREEVFPLNEIEGVRTVSTGPSSHRVSRRVICVKGRREPIETVLFSPDEFLQTWLQQFPNLDQSDQPCGSESRRRSIKRRWVIVSVTGVALICTAILIHTERKNRQLAKRAASYRVHAEQGDAKSQFALGAMYYYGTGVPKNYVEAARWYLKSAEQGNVGAEYSISFIYYSGNGLPKDYSEGARWCRKAAEQGDVSAQYSLGIIYHHGLGVPRDDAEAVRWYRKSAEQGYGKAKYNLGYMYYYGYGAPQDRVEANRLFQQVAAQGDEYAKRALECDRKGIAIDPGAGLRGLQ